MRISWIIRSAIIAMAVTTLAGCGGGAAPSAAVQAERYRVVAQSTFKNAVQSRYNATALTAPSKLYSAGLVYTLRKDDDGNVFVDDICTSLFSGGLRTLPLSDVSEVSIVQSRADGALLSNLFGASFRTSSDAKVEILLRGVEEERVPPQSLRASLINTSCRDTVRERLASEGLKPKPQRARVYVVMRSVKAQDIAYDIAFRSAAEANAALAVIGGAYQSTLLSEIKIRARPISGLTTMSSAWAFGINRVDINEILPGPGRQIQMVPVALNKTSAPIRVSALQ